MVHGNFKIEKYIGYIYTIILRNNIILQIRKKIYLHIKLHTAMHTYNTLKNLKIFTYIHRIQIYVTMHFMHTTKHSYVYTKYLHIIHAYMNITIVHYQIEIFLYIQNI